MPDIFLPRDLVSKWDSENFVQDAWKQVSDIWAQQANAAAPDLALQAEQQAQQQATEQQRAQERAAYQQQSDAATQAGLQQAMQEQYGQQQAQQWAAQAYGQAATATTGVTPLQTASAAPAATDQGQPAQTTPDTSNLPSGASGNYVAAAWQAAQKYNLDPQTFVKQIQQESGFQPFNADGTPKTSPAGAIGIAQFMPDTAKGAGVNPTDPLASLDAAAKMMAGYVQKYGGDMAKALAAYNAGPGNVDKFGGVPPFAETQNYVKTILGDAAGLGQQLATKAQQGLGAAAQQVQDTGAGALRVVNAAVQNVASDLRPSQFGVGLSSAEAEAACGPVAAMAFARATGRNPTAEEAVQLAKQVGWSAQSGMAGPASEVSLLKSMGVASHMEQGADVNKIAQDVQNGNPVIISTPGHYFVADDFDPNSGAFHVGTSGTDLRAGSAWMSLGQMQQVMGQAQATLYLDRQPGDGPSVATQMAQGGGSPQQPLTMGTMQPATPAAPATPDVGSGPSGFNPFRAVGDLAGSVGSTVGNAFSGLLGAGGGLLNRPQAGPNDNPGALASPASLSVGSTPAGTIDPLSGTVPSSAPPLDQALQQGGTGGASLASPGQLPFGGGTAADLITGPLSAAYNSPLRQELAPNIGDPNHPFNVMQEMQDKYGGLLNPARMTPEDRERYLNASMAVGGVASPLEGGQAAASSGGMPSLQDFLANAPRASSDSPIATVQSLTNKLRDPEGPPGIRIEQGYMGIPGGPEVADTGERLAVYRNDQGQPVGILHMLVDRSTNQPDLLQIAVDPAYQRQGIASQLYQAAQDAGYDVNAASGAGGYTDAGARLAYARQYGAPAGQTAGGAGPLAGRPLFGRGGVPGGPVGGLQAPPPATAAEDVEGALAQSLRNLGMPEEQITALRSATNPPPEVVPTANGIGPKGADVPPISTDPSDFDANVQQALEQHAGAGGPPDGGIAPPRPLPAPGEPVTPRAPGSAWQVLSAYHSGNIVMGPATLAKVAVNAAFSPVWNLTTQSARDLLTLNVDRVAGRGVGFQQALVNMGNDFMDGFGQAMANRTTSSIPLVDDLLQAQHAVGGALHAGFQNIGAEAVRRMELGAAAGEQVAAQNGRGVSGLSQIADLIRDPTGLPDDAVARANDLADRAGLRAPAGMVQQTVQNMLNQAANTPVGAVTNFLLPVFRIGAQAEARGIEALPIGLAGTAFDVARGAAGFGPYARGFSQYGGAVTPLADRLTNNIAGTALTAWLGSKALDGTVTGVGPEDPRARANLEAQGWRPESVLVPGIGYVSYARLPEQLQKPLQFAGAFGDASAMHQGDPGAAALEMTRQMKEMLAKGMPGISTLADLGGILKGDPYAVGFLVGGSAGGYIPGSAVLGNIASATDPTARQIPTKQGFGPAIAGSIEQNLPALREQLEPSVNVLGQTKPNPAAGLAQFLPVRTPGEVAPGTPGLQGLRVLNASGVVLPAAPPQLSVANGRSVQMTDAERQQFDQFRSALLDQAIGSLATNANFNAAPAAARKQILNRLLQQVDTAASRQTLGSIAQTGDLVSRIGPSGRQAQGTATLIRPPLPLNEPAAATSSLPPPQSALPITSDLATLSPLQQDQLRQR